MESIEHVLRIRMACLGDVSRFRIVAVLLRAPSLSVTGIAREVGLSQSCTTRHLQTLRKAGVVDRARAGKEVRFAVHRDDPDLLTLLGWMASGTMASATLAPVVSPRTLEPAAGPRAPAREVARKRRIADTAPPSGSMSAGDTAPKPGDDLARPRRRPDDDEAGVAPEAAAPRRYHDLEDFLL